MDNIKNDLYYAQKIVTDLQFILDNTVGIKKVDLALNEVLLDSVMFRLIQVSESASKVTSEFKAKHSAIPWTSVESIRDRIVYKDDDVDLTIIYDTITKDINKIADALSELV